MQTGSKISVLVSTKHRRMLNMKTNNQVFLEGTNGKAVMLMHGLTSGAAQMLPMAQFLNNYGYSVSCVNIAGHGTYPEDFLHTNAEDMFKKAEYDYLALKKNYDTVYVGGLSTGGLLSLMLCSKYPEIAGFIAISTPLSLVPGSFISNHYPEGTIFIERSMDGKEGLFKQYHIHYEKIAICIFNVLAELMKKTSDKELLNKIKCPGLVIQAYDDTIGEPKSATHILENVSSKRIESYRPDTGGHLIVLTDERLGVFKRTIEFLERL